MTAFRRLVAAAAAVLLGACGTVKNTTADGDDARLMLRGNDPVAYFTEGKPTPGRPDIKADYDGVTYRFVSAENRAAFEKNPARYAPQYAGYCASGMPYALKAAIGADVFAVVDGKLYMFGSERSRRHWLMDAQKNVALGDHYWLAEVKDSHSRVQNLKRYVFKVDHYKTDEQLEAEYQRRRAAGTLPAGLEEQRPHRVRAGGHTSLAVPLVRRHEHFGALAPLLSERRQSRRTSRRVAFDPQQSVAAHPANLCFGQEADARGANLRATSQS
jgi:YHS domain-containing protein